MRSTTRAVAGTRSMVGSPARHVWVALSFASMFAFAGCGKTSTSSSGGAKGYGQGTFKVMVQNGQDGNFSLRIKGGRVYSDDLSINCGLGPSGEALTLCTREVPLGSTVVLHATAYGNDATLTPPKPYVFLGWAGDCWGDRDCTLTATVTHVTAR